jgi:TRAP-type mannitol/chloroaromatic compound transport system permease small subunit
MGLTKLIFSKTELFFNFITQSFNIIGTILIIFIMIIVNADVIGRELFLKPIAGVPMMVSMSIVAIVFLQTPQTFNRGRLTQNVSILNTIGRRAPIVKLLLDITYSIAAFFLILQIFKSTYPLFIKSWVRNTYEGTIGDFTAPIWPIKFVILLGCFLLMVQIMLFGIRQVIKYYDPTHQENESEKIDAEDMALRLVAQNTKKIITGTEEK